jgi:endogenous inhibitor of DNA gyrase (YacG/DUF329 family)
MKAPTCAVCGKKPVDAAYRPFCSKRCADIDLGRWLSDRYAIPAVENESADEEDWPLNDPDQD